MIESLPELPVWLQPVFAWFEKQPAFLGLLTLMVIDVAMGICLSIVKKTFCSALSWRGMAKKAMVLLLVGMAAVMQPMLPGMPILNIVAVFFTITEAISIMENAAAAGVPLPAGLVDTLAKLKEQQRLMRAQKQIPPPPPK